MPRILTTDINKAQLSNKPSWEKDDGQIIMLSDPACDTCDAMKDAFEGSIETGHIEVVSIQTEDGKALMQQLGVSVVPVFVVMVDEKVFNAAEIVAAEPKDE